jgi:hypothetical protein
MATWVDLEDSNYFGFTYKDSAGTYPSDNKMKVSLQYDKDTATPEQIKVRFKCELPSGKKYTGQDGLYILYDANNSSNLRSVYQIKGHTGTGVSYSAFYTNAITLTKDYDAGTFFLQDIWVCNTGAGTIDINKQTVKYSEGTWNFYDLFKDGGRRATYAYRQTSGQYVPMYTTETVAIDGGSPTLYVADKGNNTATMSGALGKNGTNHALQSATLYYTTDGTDPKDSSTRSSVTLTASSSASYSKSVSVTKACTIKAYIKCVFEYNTTTGTASTSVKYYVKPTNPGTPKISYTKSRLTVKEPWTFTWTAAGQGNTSSPLKGYYLMLFRQAAGKDSFDYVRELTSSLTSDYIGIAPGTNSDNATNYYIRRENTSCTAIFKNPADFGFAPGDKVKLRIRAFTRNGANGLIQSDIVDSAEYLVQNAGIVNVKVNSAWKEGQVYIKVNNEWKEAESVSVKVNGAWKESE